MKQDEVLDRVAAIGVLPVIAVPSVEAAEPLSDALCAGGVPAIEVTLRTPCALEAIAKIRARHPEMAVGAGTILRAGQIAAAKAAGAEFLVSPGLDVDVVKAAQAAGLPIVPGVTNPSEITLGVKLGLRVLKFFPAECFGGIQALTLMHGPFPEVRFVPTGGMNMGNIGNYLAKPFVAACGGSYMAKGDTIKAGDFAKIEADCRACVEIAKEARK